MRPFHMMDTPQWKGRKGNIFLFDMEKPKNKAKPFMITGDFDLDSWSPLGTTIWTEGCKLTNTLINKYIHSAAMYSYIRI